MFQCHSDFLTYLQIIFLESWNFKILILSLLNSYNVPKSWNIGLITKRLRNFLCFYLLYSLLNPNAFSLSNLNLNIISLQLSIEFKLFEWHFYFFIFWVFNSRQRNLRMNYKYVFSIFFMNIIVNSYLNNRPNLFKLQFVHRCRPWMN